MHADTVMNSKRITQILHQVNCDSKQACDKLLPIIYDKLLDIAQMRLRHERNDHTYCRTELVHEAYFELVNIDNITWTDRSHFYAIASKCMRQLLIDYARKKKADKRGGDNEEVTYIDNMMNMNHQADNLIELDEALNKLARFDKRMAEVVECRYFGEMTIEDTADALNISASTVKRDWEKARGWLYQKTKR